MHHDAVQIPWQPVKTRRASEEIYLQLREFILSGQLKPGDRLPSERAMMAQLNRSRPTIREALRMLEQGISLQRMAPPAPWYRSRACTAWRSRWPR